jgi:hypothetical protein
MDPATLDKLREILGPAADKVINGAIVQVYIDSVLSGVCFAVLLVLSIPTIHLLLRFGRSGVQAHKQNPAGDGDLQAGACYGTIFGIAILLLLVGLNAMIMLPHLINPDYWAYKNLRP